MSTKPLLSSASVVIVNYDTLKFTRICVESLFLFYPGIELVLVDNGSTDGSRDYIRLLAEQEPNVSCILNEENWTHGPALHQGIVAAKTSLILVLDSDTYLVKGGFLELMAEQFRKDPRLFALGLLSHNDMSGTRPGPYPCVHPSSMMIQKSLYVKGRPFQRSGQPAAAAMADARGRGDHLEKFPIRDYVKHRGGATRTIVVGRLLAKRRAKSRK